MLPHISLFSGYEGFGLGLTLAGIPFRTVLYCEIENYPQEIIRQRIRDGFLDAAPIWPDVRSLDGRPFAGKVGLTAAAGGAVTTFLVADLFCGAGESSTGAERAVRQIGSEMELVLLVTANS